MKMLTRLRYLYAEGFEVAALSGYDDASGKGNAKILFVERDERDAPRLHSEVYDVDGEEMAKCSALFLAHISGTVD